jgi:hypothetical protein
MLVEFLAALVVATRQFDPTAADHGRRSVCEMLLASIRYISDVIPDRPDLMQPARELLYGLKDLDRGTVVPLLEPKKIKNRPPNSYSEGFFRADAAVLMELKRQQGRVTNEAAAGMVARRLNRPGYRDQGNRITGKRVIAWRSDIMVKAGTIDPAAQRFSFVLKLLGERYPNDSDPAYEFYVGCIVDQYTPTILKKGHT